jgi:hypothetical protein
MKKLLISLAIVLGISALFGVTITHADGTQFWKLVNGALVPVSSWSIGGTGVNGTLNTLTVTSCSGCGGGGSSTLIFAGDSILVNASGTNGYIITNNGVTSTVGNWTGTWQGVNSSTFYLTSNPSNYITTSTNNFGGIRGNGTSTWIPVYTGTSTLVGYASGTYNSSTDIWTFSNLVLNGNLAVGTTTAGANVNIYATRGSELAPAISTSTWTLQSGWTISGGMLIGSGTYNLAYPTTPLTITAGVTYEVKMTMATSSQYSSYVLGGSPGASNLGGASIDDYVTAQTTGNLAFNSAPYLVSISSISVKALTNGNLSVDNSLSVKGATNFINNVGFGGLTTPAYAPVVINTPSGANGLVVQRFNIPSQAIYFNPYTGNQLEIGAIGAKNLYIRNQAGAPYGMDFFVNTTDQALSIANNGDVSVGLTTDCGVFCVGTSTVLFDVSSSTGNVGIGTSQPSSTLHVVSNTTTTAIFAHSGTATSTVIEGSASSSVCDVKYTASSSAVYVTYLSSGQELVSTVSCK